LCLGVALILYGVEAKRFERHVEYKRLLHQDVLFQV
jgi:hypothetical protein